jgi:aryl-alcohol dehydrogenase-like predicted oxidoreductase
VLGEIVRELGVADRLFTATKVGATGRDEGVAQMQRSMERLAPQDIDLMQVHNLTDVDTQLGTLRELKQAGRIRYLGVTTSSDRQYEALEAVMRRETLDFVQLDYSIDNRGVEERLLPLAQERGMAVLVNLPFGRARLFSRVAGREVPAWAREQLGIASWAQYFLKFLLGHPAVTAVIPATSDPGHLADNMGAAVGDLPGAELRERMARDFAG